jgi:hypothetical protein
MAGSVAGGNVKRISQPMLGWAALLLMVTPSCASGDGSTAAAETTVTTVVTAEPSSTPVDSSSARSSESTLTSPPGTPQSTPRSGEPLQLEDFFEPGPSWEANRFDIAGRTDVQGIAGTVNTCYAASAIELELRLSNKFETLTFSVAQADNSARSDQNLTVEVLTNNEQADIRAVPFNQVQEISVPVGSVNAVQFRFYLDPNTGDCGGSVVAVLHDVTVS